LDLAADLTQLLAAPWHLPLLVTVGWVVRIPLVSREEGHEAITRAAWDGLALTAGQRRALIRGVRAPDVSLVGLLTTALPFAQRRHALRAWSGSTTADGIQAARDFMTSRHLLALALADGAGRWATFGEVLHCLQDSYSPAHTDRIGAQIVRMRHWGPLDWLRPHDEHGFPSDRRDEAWGNGELTEEANAAIRASRRYLELVTRGAGAREFAVILDECAPITADET
jgi:hypothetical protein